MKFDIRKFSNQELLVSPSILAANFNNLTKDIQEVINSGADILHLDVMDGTFVPNISFGPPVISGIRKENNILFDTHLMIERPLFYMEAFAKAGADHVTFHLESEATKEDVFAVINRARELDLTVGISIKPKTPISEILPYLESIDLVLIMSVEPGFGGQSFMAEVLPKTKELRDIITEKNLNVHIEIDGGIDENTVDLAVKHGANIVVAGTSVFRNKLGMAKAIELLKDAERNLYI